MSQGSNNLYAKRMRKLLRGAFMELIEERNFDAITVGEIASQALVSRAAFYRYYQDKYDLVEHIFEEAMQFLVQELGPPSHDVLGNLDRQHLPEPCVKLFEHIANYERLYRALLEAKGNAWFVTKMRASVAHMLHARILQLTHSSIMMRTLAEGFAPDLIARVQVEVVILWLERGRPVTPRQAATHSYHLALAILKDMTTQN